MQQVDGPMTFTPCSARHKHCSPSHAALVRSYQAERERQETAMELTLSYAGDRKLWQDRGGRLITFKDWLCGNRIGESSCGDR